MKIKILLVFLSLLSPFFCLELNEAKDYFKKYVPLVLEVKEQKFRDTTFFIGYDKEKLVSGYMLSSDARGIAGDIKLLAVISPEGSVLDYLILQKDPKEPLDKLEKEGFRERCIGKSSFELKLTIFDPKNGKVEPVIDAIMTCRAVLEALKTATTFIDALPVNAATGRKTPGSITVDYKRSSEGKFTGRNRTIQLSYRTVVWIEDGKGLLIKTLYRSVGGTINPFPAHLTGWEEKSGKISDNTPDTYTSATVNGGTAETSYSFTWDCKDNSDQIVADGKYTYKVEVSRYYKTSGGQAPWRSGGAQSGLSIGIITKGPKNSSSTGTPDASALLSSLGAKFEPK